MEINDRLQLITLPKIDFLESLSDNGNADSSIVRDLVSLHNKIITENNYDNRILETFRTILCHEYRSFINSRSENCRSPCNGTFYVDFTRLFITNNACLTEEDCLVLHDIVVLQSVLYSNRESLIKSFDEFSERSELSTTPEMRDLAMRVAGCFADCYNLHNHLYASTTSSAVIEKLTERILAITALWMDRDESFEWKSLASLLPKLVAAFAPENIVPHFWSRAIGSGIKSPGFVQSIYLDEQLFALCAMADVCFPSATENIRGFHYEQSMQKEFWSLLSRGIVSPVSQQRKQALYLIKRAMEFVDSHKSQLRQQNWHGGDRNIPLALDRSAMPFMGEPTAEHDVNLETRKKRFFLILEVLEEKQKHLVLPTLANLGSLYLNVAWLRCVLTRILQHDNNSVKLYGLEQILSLTPNVFEDKKFLDCVIEGLNNNYFYEINAEMKVPGIVKDLQDCLWQWDDEETNLINLFVRGLPSVSWSPIPIYWVLTALLHATDAAGPVSTQWHYEELQSMRKLIRKSISTFPFKMRTYSHAMIIYCVTEYVEKPADPLNFDCIFDIFSLFAKSRDWTSEAAEVSQVTICWEQFFRPSDAQEYVVRICERGLETDRSLQSFAHMIVLMAQAKLIMTTRRCPTITALRNLLQNLDDADVRSYADQDFLLKIVTLTSHLINRLAECYEDETELSMLVLPYRREIIKIASRSLQRDAVHPYDDYLFAMKCVVSSRHMPTFDAIGEGLREVEVKYIDVIAKPLDFSEPHWLYAIKMWDVFVHTTEYPNLGFDAYANIDANTDCHEESAKKYFPVALKYLTMLMAGNDEMENVSRQNEGPRRKFVSDCLKTISGLMSTFSFRYDARLPAELWFHVLAVLTETDDDVVITNVSKIFLDLFRKSWFLTSEDVATIDAMIRTTWRTVLQLKKTSGFSSAMSSMIPVIINDKFLELDGAKTYAIECVEEMIQDEEEYPKFSSKQALVTAMQLLTPENKLLFFEAFAFILIHDNGPRRDQKIFFATMLHRHRFDDRLNFADDRTTRAFAIAYLTQITHVPESARIRELLLRELLGILEKNKNKRYFNNSDLHKLKNRVMQALLIMEPGLDDDQSQRLFDALCDLLLAESNQPSVRLMHEWLIIRLCLSRASMEDHLWTLFQKAADKRPGSLVSLASIVFHLSRQYFDAERTAFIVKAIPRLLPHCMGQLFTVRLYSQRILVTLYGMLPKYSPEAESYSEIYDSVEKSLSRGIPPMENEWTGLFNFYFMGFDPILDYNAQTIYNDIPRLTNVSIDEWVPRTLFEDLPGWNFSPRTPLPSRDQLRQACPLTHHRKPGGDRTEPVLKSGDNGPSDIQKKIIPCTTMVPCHEDASEIPDTKLLRDTFGNNDAGVIVVASLIDRPSTLGGLARACEIFRANELVVGSLRYVENREFQTLSVSAEKWIKITEVKPNVLQNYLLKKQSEGWELISAEQMASGENLVRVELPKKTILVFGNGREGIPANSVPVMDPRVEIPQNAVVRSSNVHVMGAMCLWQYVKQHILT